MTSEMPWFARRLKELRLAAKMTQKELAERSGMHLGGIFKLEQGVNHPSWDTVQRLTLALGVRLDDFADPTILPLPPRRGRPRKAVAASGRPKG